MRRKIKQHAVDEKMNMTPLIDCVFLLIMFFILTTEITIKVSPVELPFALEGRTKDVGEQDITQMVEVIIDDKEFGPENRGAGKILIEQEEVNAIQLVEKLRAEVLFDWQPEPEGRGRAREEIAIGGGRVKKLSQLKLRIRADYRAKAAYLRTIFTACADDRVGIYKIELSSEEPRQLNQADLNN